MWRKSNSFFAPTVRIKWNCHSFLITNLTIPFLQSACVSIILTHDIQLQKRLIDKVMHSDNNCVSAPTENHVVSAQGRYVKKSRKIKRMLSPGSSNKICEKAHFSYFFYRSCPIPSVGIMATRILSKGSENFTQLKIFPINNDTYCSIPAPATVYGLFQYPFISFLDFMESNRRTYRWIERHEIDYTTYLRVYSTYPARAAHLLLACANQLRNKTILLTTSCCCCSSSRRREPSTIY